MKYRILILIAAALAFASCGTLASSSSGSSSSNTETSGNNYSRGSYQPSSNDITTYNDDVNAYLKAKLPNYDEYKDAAIIVDDKVVDDMSDVKLRDVKNVSVFEKAPSLKTGEKSTHGAIVIKTK